MENSFNSKNIFSGKNLARNTVYNLIGYGIPLLFAIILIPILITQLGDERFGLLSLIWVVIGYSSFLDFGIGKSLTKIVAEKIVLDKEEEISDLFWTSIFMMFIISSIGSLILFFLVPNIVYDWLNISAQLKEESLISFSVLLLGIPIVSTTSGLKGILEAYQKFGIINIIRILLGVSTFLGPILCLLFSEKLFWIVLVLNIIRGIIFTLYLIQCLRINSNIKKKIRVKIHLIKPLLKMGGWITISTVTGPFIMYLDRFLIGALLTVTAITYYGTPYEVVTKLLLIPGAVITVLFPAFSATFIQDRLHSARLFKSGLKYVFMVIFPFAIIISFYSFEGLDIWLGDDFAIKSAFILRTLSLGVLINSIAYLPFHFLIGIGKAKTVSKIQLAEIPVYIIAFVLVIPKYGINGVALIWTLRILIDAVILFFVSQRHLGTKIELIVFYLIIFSTLAFSVPYFVDEIIIRSILLLIILVVFFYVCWNKLILEIEKSFFKKSFIGMSSYFK